MTGRDTTSQAGPPDDGDATWPALEPLEEAGPADDLISPSRLLRYLDESRSVPDDGDEELGDGAPVPRITSMPEGVRVEQRRVGRAVAQWILHVRCECGRRWFEVEAIDSTTCPRCGMLVYLDVDARSLRP